MTPEGTVYLGYRLRLLPCGRHDLEQAAAAIQAGLRLNNPQVSVALGQFRGVQQVRGDHIVSQDGTITLGTFGCVSVTGLTISQAKCEIERHLSRWLLDPIVSVSVSGYNSKVYYVIADGGGFGQQVYRFPITGNETVLDAISMINGLPPVSSKRHIWLARPTPAQTQCYEILPVNWEAITEAGPRKQLAALPRRPRVRQGGLLHHHRQRAFQDSLADRTAVWRHAARHQHGSELPQHQQQQQRHQRVLMALSATLDPEHLTRPEGRSVPDRADCLVLPAANGRYC